MDYTNYIIAAIGLVFSIGFVLYHAEDSEEAKDDAS